MKGHLWFTSSRHGRGVVVLTSEPLIALAYAPCCLHRPVLFCKGHPCQPVGLKCQHEHHNKAKAPMAISRVISGSNAWINRCPFITSAHRCVLITCKSRGDSAVMITPETSSFWPAARMTPRIFLLASQSLYRLTFRQIYLLHHRHEYWRLYGRPIVAVLSHTKLMKSLSRYNFQVLTGKHLGLPTKQTKKTPAPCAG